MKDSRTVLDFIGTLPKAELHLHIEGTLEPELMFQLAERNGVDLAYRSVEDVKKAYAFTDLQSFLDIYYDALRVLIHERDFYDLTWAYLRRAHEQNVRHVEMFFDPQAHTDRGVYFGSVVRGITAALNDAQREFALTSKLILCFLRHLSAQDAMRTLEQALQFRELFHGVGLDSSEVGHPPEKFASVVARAREEGLFAVAHAGEEGPPAYVWQALDILRAVRIDHGVRCVEDPALVQRLKRDRVPLTVCPLSNIRLRVFSAMEEHNIRQLLESGLCVTINSDDPAYFGGYINENFCAVQQTFQFSRSELKTFARNSFQASVLASERKKSLIDEVNRLSD